MRAVRYQVEYKNIEYPEGDDNWLPYGPPCRTEGGAQFRATMLGVRHPIPQVIRIRPVETEQRGCLGWLFPQH